MTDTQQRTAAGEEVADEIQDSEILQWLKDTGCKYYPLMI